MIPPVLHLPIRVARCREAPKASSMGSGQARTERAGEQRAVRSIRGRWDAWRWVPRYLGLPKD